MGIFFFFFFIEIDAQVHVMTEFTLGLDYCQVRKIRNFDYWNH